MVKEHLTVKNNGCRYYEQSLVWGCAPEFSGACRTNAIVMRALSLNSTKNYNLVINSNRTLFRVGTRFRQFNDYVLCCFTPKSLYSVKIVVEMNACFFIEISK